MGQYAGDATKPTILVTGGAGYIGSHTVKALQSDGYRVVVLDNLVYGHRDIVEQVLKAELLIGDIGDRVFLEEIFSTYAITAVIHFAAYGYVGESVEHPAKYYENNVAGTLSLLTAMKAASVTKLVFSSTCATYGIPETLPITETHPQQPINPYGKSKLMVEQLLADFDTAYGMKSVIFRYFNAAGADPSGQLGEDHSPETHLIPLVLQVALGQRTAISILGTDYPTADGTCIRDYLHVSDLARAHILGLEYLLAGADSQTFNLSNGSGVSVRQLIETAEAVTNRPIKVVEEARRVGDPAVLIGSSEKAFQYLGWEPQYPDLKDIVAHAWQWHQRRHGNVDFSPAAEGALMTPSALSSAEADILPLVSVIVPVYNAETFIAKTLASVIAQTHRRLEILVVDDGSSDRTPSIVRAMAQQDRRIKLFKQANAGVAAARNTAIEKAQGEYIAPIDADDLWHPETLEKLLIPFHQGDPQLGVVYAWSIDIDEQDLSTGGFHAATISGDIYKTLICHNFLGNASSTLIRKDCLTQIGSYDTRFQAQNARGCEDWDLYLRLAEQFKFGVVPEFLVGYRKNSSSMSGDFRQMARSQQIMLQTIKKNHPKLPNYLYRLSRSSFYLYLAQQSDSYSASQSTLFWLRQAVIADPITPLSRPGLYILWVKSLVKQININSVVSQAKNRSVATIGSPAYALLSCPVSVASNKISRLKVWLKLLVGTILHLSLSRA